MIVDCGFDGHPVVLEHFGPRLQVRIGFDRAFDVAAKVAPDLSVPTVSALVDTGASVCFIDDDYALANNLPVVDRDDVVGAFGTATVNVYSGQMHIPNPYGLRWHYRIGHH